MSITEKFNQWIDGIKEYIQTEKNLIRYRFIRSMSSIAGNVFSFLVILISAIIMLAMIWLWIGFMISSWLDNYPLGFGVTALLAIIQLVIMVVFRKQILVKPFMNVAISAMMEDENIPEDDEKDTEKEV